MQIPLFRTFVFVAALQTASAQVQAPALAGAGAPISSQDRIYTGDQTSNTITVIDPSSLTVLGTINVAPPRLGNTLNPQNVASANSHGLGFSRDGKFIVSLSTLTNTVRVYRTANNTLVSTAYVDRGPHEAFFAPDNRTVWVGTRGVQSVQIIDGFTGESQARIRTANGPSKVLFSPDGATAYVNHIRDPLVAVVDVASRTVRYNITGLADSFSSDMMLSADGGSLWVAHKMTGQVSVLDLAARKVLSILETGPETNHPNFAIINGTTHAFVTVGALNATRVYRQPNPSTTPVFLKNIVQSGIEPHGIWPSADNSRMYIVNEHSDTVDVVDTNSLQVIHTMSVGQEGQALIYVSGAVPRGSTGTENLSRQGLSLKVTSLRVPVTGAGTKNDSNAQITIRQTLGLDMFQIIGRNLVLNDPYTVSARCNGCPSNSRTPLVHFNATVATRTGCGSAPQVLAFLPIFDAYDLNSFEVKRG